MVPTGRRSGQSHFLTPSFYLFSAPPSPNVHVLLYIVPCFSRQGSLVFSRHLRLFVRIINTRKRAVHGPK